MIKAIIKLVHIFFVISLAACARQKLPYSDSIDTNKSFGKFIDERDQNVYSWIKLADSSIWMIENARFNVEGSRCYDELKANCEKYGRMYDWEQAMKACPKDWQLASDNDMWNTLNGRVYNVWTGQKKNTNKISQFNKEEFSILTEKQDSQLYFPLSGVIVLPGTTYCKKDTIARYLTRSIYIEESKYIRSNEENKKFIVFYDFTEPNTTVTRNWAGRWIDYGASCKCVKTQ